MVQMSDVIAYINNNLSVTIETVKHFDGTYRIVVKTFLDDELISQSDSELPHTSNNN